MICAGEKFPSLVLSLKGKELSLEKEVRTKYGVIIGVPGAFDPRATEALVPAWKELSNFLKQNGLGFLGCLTVNDPHVIKGWARKLRISDKIVFISDVRSYLVKALGLEADAEIQELFGSTDVPRAAYFIIILKPGSIVEVVYHGSQVFTLEPIHKICSLLNTSLPVDLESDTLNYLTRKTGLSIERCHELKRGFPYVAPPKELGNIVIGDPNRILLPDSTFVSDVEHPSVTFDLSDCSLLEEYNVTPRDGLLEIDGCGEPMGRVTAEYFRPLAFDAPTGRPKATGFESPRTASAGDVFNFVTNKVIIDHKRKMLLKDRSSTVSSSCLLVMVNSLRDENIPQSSMKHNLRIYPIVVVIPIMEGGRDVTLANMMSCFPVMGTEDEKCPSRMVRRQDMLDPEYGIDIRHYIYSYLQFYRFDAPCPYLDGRVATWLVSRECCFASEGQLSFLEQASARCPPAPGNSRKPSEQPLGGMDPFLIACDCI